jgi:hypothetical protein
MVGVLGPVPVIGVVSAMVGANAIYAWLSSILPGLMITIGTCLGMDLESSM